MAIKCCKDCVPPVRHAGCHSECEQYIKEKAEFEKRKELIKSNKTVMISNYDFDVNASCRPGSTSKRRRPIRRG